MLYGILADAVTVAHLGFILFVAAGALLALRWPWLVWAHIPALAWGMGTVLIGFTCPLTHLELALRRRAGEQSYDGGFVDHYLENVVYPEHYTGVLQALVALAVVAGYVMLSSRRSRLAAGGAGGPHSPPLSRSVSAGSGPQRVEEHGQHPLQLGRRGRRGVELVVQKPQLRPRTRRPRRRQLPGEPDVDVALGGGHVVEEDLRGVGKHDLGHARPQPLDEALYGAVNGRGVGGHGHERDGAVQRRGHGGSGTHDPAWLNGGTPET